MRIWENEIELDSSAVSRVFAILAQRGAGKSYAAGKLAEEFLAAGAQSIIIDPVGVWWGLRLAADGKTPAHEVAVLGGLHADLELADTMGEAVADALVHSSSSAVLDVSMMTKSAQRRFLTDFAERFFHLKKGQRSPVHLFLEEAQEIAPQHVHKGMERMLGAFESIVKLGRNFGIGATLISQRPQAVHKDVLNQADVLLCLRTTGPHERKAIEGWIREHEQGKGERAHLQDIAKLQPGEVVVWSPSWLGAYFRTRILRKETFDASATPTMASVKRVLPKLDLSALRGALQSAGEESSAAAAPRQGQRRQEPQRATQEPSSGPDWATLELGRLRARVGQLEEGLAGAGVALNHLVQVLASGLAKAQELQRQVDLFELKASYIGGRPIEERPPVERPAIRVMAPKPEGVAGLKAGARRMLREIGEWHGIRILTRRQLATLTEMTATGGTFGTYLGQLKGLGYVTVEGDGLEITELGLEQLGGVTPAPTRPAQIAERFGQHFRRGAREMFTALVDVYPEAWTKARLATSIGMEVSGGTFGTYFGQLLGNGLIEKTRGGVRAAEWIFTREQKKGRSA